MMKNSAALYDTDLPRHLILDEFRELLKYRDLIAILTSNNMTTRYKRSVLGVAWTLLEPLGMMLVMTVVFSTIMSRNVPSFPTFLFSGMTVWTFFSQATNKSMIDLVGSWRILQKVYVPNTAFVIAGVLSALVNMVLSIGIMFFVMLVTQHPFSWALLFLPISMILAGMFTLGVALILTAISIFFNDIKSIYTIVLKFTFYLSGIFYTMDKFSEPFRTILTWNPTHILIILFRDPVYYGRIPSVPVLVYFSVLASVILMIGLHVFTKIGDQIAYRA